MSSQETTQPQLSDWELRLDRLAARIRRVALAELRSESDPARVNRPVSQGVADVTYAVDRATENELSKWLLEVGAEQNLSLFSEDTGWRHVGPDGRGGVLELEDFDHGGVRLVIDPVDGTRNLMADLRSAWTVIALCGPGSIQPRLSEVELGVISELPDSRAARYRMLCARQGCGATLEERALADDEALDRAPLRCDDDQRVEHGYFSFFRYTPAQRPRLAALEAEFFSRLEQHEGANPRYCYDDQYISNGGQLALLSLGTYRFIADLRADLAPGIEADCTTSKPYDCAGAILVAREAGCVVHDADGALLDFPLDATTPVSFVGYANTGTAGRLEPHLLAARSGIAPA